MARDVPHSVHCVKGVRILDVMLYSDGCNVMIIWMRCCHQVQCCNQRVASKVSDYWMRCCNLRGDSCARQSLDDVGAVEVWLLQ